MSLSTLFFDLDDTLYPPSTGLWSELKKRMEVYMHERMGIPPEEISPLRAHLFHEYGTTLRGLQMTRGVDTLEFLAYVHDVPLADYIAPDPAVRAMLLSLPQRKLIFTNADANHARRVLSVLGLQDCFDGIIDILAIAPYCKPQEESFRIALQHAGNPDPRECLFIDDSPRNLAPARKLGFFTVRVSSDLPCEEADVSIERLLELPGVLPNSHPPQIGGSHA